MLASNNVTLPPSWERRRLKWVARFSYGDSLPDEKREEGEVSVYGSNGIVGRHNTANTLAPCIVIGRKGSYGKLSYSSDSCFAIDTTYFIDRRSCPYDLKWLYYALHPLMSNQVSKDSAVPGLSRDDVYDDAIAFPPFQVQQAIASFLDKETSRIDALIAKKQRQIELLEEKRTAIITSAITKGLKPNAKMKNSGVKWIGEIPEGWQVLQLRRVVAKFIDYRGRTPTKTADGIRLITARNVRRGKIDWSESVEFMAEGEYKEFMRRGKPKVGDVIFTSEAPLGQVAQIDDENVALAQRLILFKVNPQRMTNDFLCLYFQSFLAQADLQSRASGSTAEGIRSDKLFETRVIVPPLVEQGEITGRTPLQITSIENSLLRIKESISILQELRSSLVTTAVSGQIDISKMTNGNG
jgi:type I restriction enzyme, S subunit